MYKRNKKQIEAEKKYEIIKYNKTMQQKIIHSCNKSPHQQAQQSDIATKKFINNKY